MSSAYLRSPDDINDDVHSIGLDISNLTYTCSCVTETFQCIWYGKTFDQTEEGWQQLLTLLSTHAIQRDDLKGVIMENTGCYSERISYWLYEHGFDVFVEPPHKIKKALYEEEKTDPIDSRQIAEYAFRFPDRLHPWQPPDEILDQIHVMLMAYEHLSKTETAAKNTIKSLKKKHRTYTQVIKIYDGMRKQSAREMKSMEKDILAILATNPELAQKTRDIMTLKYLGIILSCHIMLATDGYKEIDHLALAKYAGVRPLRHTSGTSVNKKKRSRSVGPRKLRKNLYLAAMRMIAHNDDFKAYYNRKLAEGKKKKVALNNIINKLLKIVCGVLKSGKPYIYEYRSVKPE